MGCCRLLLLSLALLLLLITSSTHGHAQAAAVDALQGRTGDGAGRSMVGSRPPSCAGRCWWCGDRRCEAVQVPITPQETRRHGPAGGGGAGGGAGASSAAAALKQQQQSYADHSNYKPLSWRCKCGGLLKP